MAKKNAYDGLTFDQGLDLSLMENAIDIIVNLDEIEIRPQVRSEWEDDEGSLLELGESLQKHQVHQIFLGINPQTSSLPYLLIAGERRVRAARKVGMTTLRARAAEVTDELAFWIQAQENIQRKNLTQFETAQVVRSQVDALGGNFDAWCAEHKKSKAWLSKQLALLNLGEAAQSLVSKNISADTELLIAVSNLEKKNPEKARETVEALAKHRTEKKPKESARSLVAQKTQEASGKKPTKKPPAKPAKDTGGSVATPKNRSVEEPGPASMFSSFGSGETKDDHPGQRFSSFSSDETSPIEALDQLSEVEQIALEKRLRVHFDAGEAALNPTLDLVDGFKQGAFGTSGDGVLRLAAFVQGVRKREFDLAALLASIKP